MQSTKLSAWLSVAALLMLAVLTGYGLAQNYRLEKGRLRREVELVVREVSMQQQVRFFWNDSTVRRRVSSTGVSASPEGNQPAPAIFIRRSSSRMDSAAGAAPNLANFRMFRDGRGSDRNNTPSIFGPLVVYAIFPPWDSMPASRYAPLFSAALQKAGLPHLFHLNQVQDTTSSVQGRISIQGVALANGKDSLSFQGQPRRLELTMATPVAQILGRMVWPLVLALSMLAITGLAFYANRRGLLAQQRLLAAKNDLISNIGHELKTPVATVGVALEAIQGFQQAQQPQKVQEYLAISRMEVQRLSLLVEKVLQQAMLGEGKLQVQLQPLNLATVVSQVSAGMQLAFDQVQGKLTLQAPDTFAMADEVHVASILYNLLDNALKYRSSLPLSVQVSLHTAGAWVMLEVVDNGLGIPETYRTKVFERFFRVPTPGDHSVKGHGLGLSYVQQVTQAMGGQISLEPMPGGGSRFRVTLPAAAV